MYSGFDLMAYKVETSFSLETRFKTVMCNKKNYITHGCADTM